MSVSRNGEDLALFSPFGTRELSPLESHKEEATEKSRNLPLSSSSSLSSVSDFIEAKEEVLPFDEVEETKDKRGVQPFFSSSMVMSSVKDFIEAQKLKETDGDIWVRYRKDTGDESEVANEQLKQDSPFERHIRELSASPWVVTNALQEENGCSDENAETEEERTESELILVDFVSIPEGHQHTKKYDVKTKLAKIRQSLQKELGIPDGALFLMNMTGAVQCDGVLDVSKCLAYYGLKKGNRIGIELRVNFGKKQPIDTSLSPDIIHVKIPGDEGQPERIVRVLIEKPPLNVRTFLGGYRHKQKQVVYYNVATQTASKVKKGAAFRYHRDTQTYEWRARSSQSCREAGVQMSKAGVHVSDNHDRVMTPRKYVCADDVIAFRTQKSIVIQSHARGMFARTKADLLRKKQMALLQEMSETEERNARKAEERHKQEIHRRMYPKTFADFQILHNELQAWRRNEARSIDEQGYDEPSRQAALRELLNKEIKLLQLLSDLKRKAHENNKEAKIRYVLESMSKPHIWPVSGGEVVTVYTPFTKRCQELSDLYNALKLPGLTLEERLSVLLHVKLTVKEFFYCNLSREIAELIDREADVLNRGRSERSVKGLRHRLANLFLQFIQTPQFNPEAKTLEKYPKASTISVST